MNLLESRRRLLNSISKNTFTVTIIMSDEANDPAEDSYIRYNNVNYHTGDSFECKKGDEIFCYLYGNWEGCQILLNGSVVAEAVNPTYSMLVESDVTITVHFKPYGEAKMFIITE